MTQTAQNTQIFYGALWCVTICNLETLLSVETNSKASRRVNELFADT